MIVITWRLLQCDDDGNDALIAVKHCQGLAQDGAEGADYCFIDVDPLSTSRKWAVCHGFPSWREVRAISLSAEAGNVLNAARRTEGLSDLIR